MDTTVGSISKYATKIHYRIGNSKYTHVSVKSMQAYTTVRKNRKHLILEYRVPLIETFVLSYYTLPDCWLEWGCCCPSNDIVAVGMDNCECVGVFISTTVGRRPLEEGDMAGGRWEGCDWIGGTCARPCACAERGDTSDSATPVVVG